MRKWFTFGENVRNISPHAPPVHNARTFSRMVPTVIFLFWCWQSFGTSSYSDVMPTVNAAVNVCSTISKGGCKFDICTSECEFLIYSAPNNKDIWS